MMQMALFKCRKIELEARQKLNGLCEFMRNAVI